MSGPEDDRVTTPARPSDSGSRIPADVPERIGHYRLRRRIGMGGMGAVYEATQEKPRRSVAIKLMRRGVVSEAAMRRFEFESQLLARLKHPGIAEVYEAGTHDDGDGPVPWFAMEYVPDATPITEFAEAKKLALRDRLALFVRVCDAVQHGHQKGIIHRDLKPDNIIVATDGRPKIIDFGVARATDSDLVMATQQTEFGQLVGTLQYMSPEQVSGDPQSIDIRSDVYSLGVILYELLAGKRPYDLAGVPPVEAARRIQQEAPSNLSTITRGVAGDLATITHKALEKDRVRRYQSAGELVGDIQRFLENQPIMARPPTVGYQLRVFARRNKVVVVGAVGLLMVLVAGVATSTTLYLRAEKARARAERAAERSLAAIGFTEEVLSSTRPAFMSENVNVAEVLSRVSERMEEMFPDDPEVEAVIRISIGRSYESLAKLNPAASIDEYLDAARKHFERALDLRRRAFSPDSPELIEALESLASLLLEQGEYVEAEQLEKEVWQALRDSQGEHAPETIYAMRSVAETLARQGRLEEAVELARDVVRLQEGTLGEDREAAVSAKVELAAFLRRSGGAAESEQICRQLMEERVVPDEWNPRQDHVVRSLAASLLAQGRVQEAAGLYRDWQVPPFEQGSWVQGSVNPGDRAELVFFFHEYCPFSHQVIPRVESMCDRFSGRGLSFVGARPEWFNSTEEEFRDYVARNKLSFPIATPPKNQIASYEVRSVPSLALVFDRQVVWSGHPDHFGAEILNGVLAP